MGARPGVHNRQGASRRFSCVRSSSQSLVPRCWFDGAAAASGEVPHAGDFNDDGMSDIAWYNTTTGQVVLWLLNGTSVIGGGSPGSAPSPWQIAGMNAD